MGNDPIGAAFGNAPLATKPKKLTRRETELARVYNATVSSIAAMDGADLEELSEHLEKRAWRWTITGCFFAFASCFLHVGGLPYFLVVSAMWLCIVRDMRLCGEARAYLRVSASIATVGDRIKLLQAKRNERL